MSGTGDECPDPDVQCCGWLDLPLALGDLTYL